MSYLKSLADRFKEPSSWAGLAGIIALVGLNLDAGLISSITYVGAGIAGVLAFVLPEK